MKRKIRKHLAALVFNIGVNVIGIPEVFLHVVRYNKKGYVAQTFSQKYQY